MILEQIVYPASAIAGASGLVGVAVEARRTRQAVQQHDRTLYGTEYRDGVVDHIDNLRQEVDTDG